MQKWGKISRLERDWVAEYSQLSAWRYIIHSFLIVFVVFIKDLCTFSI